MIRVYLDSSAMYRLKEKSGWAEEMRVVLDNCKEDLLLAYSDAHVKDLLRDKSQMFKKDLALISELTNDLWVTQSMPGYITEINDCTPYDRYEYLSGANVEKEIEDIFAEVLDDSISLGLSDTLSTIMNQRLLPNFLKSIPQESMPEIYKEFISKDEWQHDFLTFKEYSKLILQLSKSLEDSGPYYTELRKISSDLHGYKPNPKDIDNLFFNTKLKDTSIGKTYKDYIENLTKEFSKESKYFMNIITAYNSLDLLSLTKNEKIKANENTFLNINNDALHVFYGSHFDYFVTNDNDQFTKAKVAYNLNNIETKVLKPTEFLNELNFLKRTDFAVPSNILKVITHEIESSLLIRDYFSIKSDRGISCYRLTRPLLNYFNCFYILKELKQNVAYVVFMNEKCIGKMGLTYKEISSITNRAINNIGLDIENLGVFNFDNEAKKIADLTWEGRKWKLDNNYRLQLQVNKGTLGLCLNLGPFPI